MRAGRLGVAGSVRVEDGDRVNGQQLIKRDVLRQDVHLEPAVGEVVDGGLLDAQIEDRELRIAVARV